MDELVTDLKFAEMVQGEAENYAGIADESKSDLEHDLNDDDDDYLPPEPQKKNPLQCDICSKILSCKLSLKAHAITHVDAANRHTFRCEICESTFKSKPGLRYHLKTKHISGSEREKLPCPTCGRLFKSAEGRKIHMTIQHGAEGPIFKCQECPMVFARKPHLDLHMTTHGAGLHVCTICGKSYARLKDLSKHEATCGVKELCCADCGKRFRRKEALDNHSKACRENCRLISCPTCGQGFATEQALRTHQAVHRRAFGCGECPQTFATELALRKHEQTRHGETAGYGGGVEGTKVRMRRSKYDLFIGLEHLADPSKLIETVKPTKVEMKPLVDPTPRSFPCEHCSLKFVTPEALTNHNQRRHWEAVGLQEPAAERRGRKRTRPLVRVSKKIGRPRKVISYVDPDELPQEANVGAVGLQEPAAERRGRKRTRPLERVPKKTGRPRKVISYVDPDELPQEANIDEGKEVDVLEQEEDSTSKQVEIKAVTIPSYVDPEDLLQEMTKCDVWNSDNATVGKESVDSGDNAVCSIEPHEEIIKQEIIEFEDYGYDYFENDSTCSNEPVVDLPFQEIVADSAMPEEKATDEVDTLAVEPELKTQDGKELVILLEKLDYFALVNPPVKSCNENPPPLPRIRCEHCGKPFASRYYVTMHRIKEHGSTEPVPIKGEDFHCDQCPKSFHFETHLLNHKEIVHVSSKEPIKEKRTCWHCKKELTTMHHQINHLRIFHGETFDKTKFVRCPGCHRKYITAQELAKHVCSRKIRPKRQRYKNPVPRIQCEHCETTCGSRYYLALHRIKEHGSTEIAIPNKKVYQTTLPRNFRCNLCQKSYHLEVNLAIHKKKRHGIGQAPPTKEVREVDKRTCRHCEKQFTTFRALINHLKFIHGEAVDETQIFRCPQCFRRLMTAEEMAEHVCVREISHIEKARPFKCDLCDKTYVRKIQLEDHFSVHSERQNFHCDQCSKGFFKERQLELHKKKIHKPLETYISCETCHQLFKSHHAWKRHQDLHSDQPLHCCEYCGKKCQTKSNLRSHKHYHHPEHVGEIALANRAITCNICGISLRGKTNYKTHMLRHKGDPQHRCSFPSCDKKFYTISSKKVHEQSHTKDYKYKCNFCDYGTVARNRIVLHELREHSFNRLTTESPAT